MNREGIARGDIVDPEIMQAYLAYRRGKPIEICEITKFPRGVSRETWMVRYRAAGEDPETLVFRRDQVQGSNCVTPLRFEYDVYERLKQTPVPIAEPVWYERDPVWLGDGREFFVRRHVTGSWDPPHYSDPDPAYNALRVEIGREHVRNLALIHGVDWRKAGFPAIMAVPQTAGDCADFVLRRLREDIAKVQMQPLPMVTEAFEWFSRHKPSDVSRICLIKGTNGYGEEVFHDGKIVAMSDWELACIGDPAFDWAQLQQFGADVVDDGRLIWSLQHALDYYRELTGYEIDAEAIDYYRKLYAFYLVLFSQSATHQMAGGDLLCRHAWVGVEILQGGLAGLASAMGILVPGTGGSGEIRP